MRTVTSPRAMARLAAGWRRAGVSVGFVPTMGALHAGHAALLGRARRENRVLVASVYVNPAQFGPKEDFARYPRPAARDAALCRRLGVDVLFRPAALYRTGHETWVTVEKASAPLCGPFRPGHFRGVATVVLKLFNLVGPTRAYFGMKDFQQVRVVERMVEDLDVPVRVVRCPTVREADGLALSSRNAYLSPDERARAAAVPAALRAAAQLVKSGAPASRARRAALKILSRIPGARVQYLEVVRPDTLAPLRKGPGPAVAAAAVYLGKTRLIDNVHA